MVAEEDEGKTLDIDMGFTRPEKECSILKMNYKNVSNFENFTMLHGFSVLPSLVIVMYGYSMVGVVSKSQQRMLSRPVAPGAVMVSISH